MEKRLKNFLYETLENDKSFKFLIYQSFSVSFVLLSVILGIFYEIKGLRREVYETIRDFERLVSLIILYEFLGRLYLAKDKVSYLANPLSILDLVALIPYYQPFRLLRVAIIFARMYRIFHRYRYFFGAFIWVFKSTSYEFFFLLFFLFLFLISSTLILYSVEVEAQNPYVKNLFDALYLALITATTVGYGDKVPITFEGKVLAIVIAFGGLLLYSSITALISSSFLNYIILMRSGKLVYRKFEGHIVICGWNEISKKIVSFLSERPLEKEVVLISQHLPSNLPENLYFINGDFAKEEVLLRAGVDRASMILIFAERFGQTSEDSVDARTILASLLSRELNKNALIISEILLEENAQTFRKRKVANYVITEGELVGSIVAKLLENEELLKFFTFITSEANFELLPNQFKSVEEAQKRLEPKGYRVIGVLRDGRSIFFPRLHMDLKPKDKLILLKHLKERHLAPKP